MEILLFFLVVKALFDEQHKNTNKIKVKSVLTVRGENFKDYAVVGLKK